MDTVFISKNDDIKGTPWDYSDSDIDILLNEVDTGLQLLKFNFNTIKNSKVLLKLNLVRAHKKLSFTTDTRIVEALLRLLNDYSVGKIFVGDNATFDANTGDIGNELGIPMIAKKYNAEFIAFENIPQIKVNYPDAVLMKEFHLPKVAFDVDFMINVPKMKTHTLTQVSLAIKNHHGLVAKDDRLRHHRDDINEKLLDIYSYVMKREVLHIVDGLWAIEGQGPCDQGEQVSNMNCMIIGGNAISVDAIGSAVMGFDPREIPAVRIGDWRGLGRGTLEGIEVLGKKVEEVKRLFKRPICAISGMYKNVEAIEFSSCKGCTGHAMVSLDIMSDLEELKYIPKRALIILGNPPEGFVPPWKDRDIWLIGCANLSLERYSECGNIYQIQGCPPWLTDLRNMMRTVYNIP